MSERPSSTSHVSALCLLKFLFLFLLVQFNSMFNVISLLDCYEFQSHLIV